MTLFERSEVGTHTHTHTRSNLYMFLYLLLYTGTFISVQCRTFYDRFYKFNNSHRQEILGMYESMGTDAIIVIIYIVFCCSHCIDVIYYAVYVFF